MKNLFFLAIIVLVSGSINAQDFFTTYFYSKSMRVDFMLAGDRTSQDIFLMDMKEEPFWSGLHTSLLDPFNYGEYKFEIIDSATKKVLFTKGFCTFFEEWKTTEEAKTVKKAFFETITFPYPKASVILTIYARSWEGVFEPIFSTKINTNSYLLSKGEKYSFDTKELIISGPYEKCLDLVFIPDGYTVNEMPRFEQDVQKMMKNLFNTSPYDEYKEKINVWMVNAYSEESGADIPGEDIWKNTILNSSFYTFDIDRYLTSQDYFTIRDIASLVPYDAICILVNTEKYGGGGIYNHYCLTSSDHYLSEVVFLHEFGHSFAGLADEYFNASVAYQDYLNVSIEPWYPNITTLIDFDKKWKSMIDSNQAIPTEAIPENEGKIGVFEGACYTTKGAYRPSINCRMRGNEAKEFCPVCKKSIIEMLHYYFD